MKTNITEEYMMLRGEILNGLDAIKNHQMVLYATVAAVFTFAFTQKEPLVFLIPVVVIIPIYLMNMNQVSSILRIGAYLKIYLEGDEFLWETRLSAYDSKYSPHNPNIDPYVCISIICFILCLARMDYSNLQSVDLWVRIVISISYMFISLFIIKNKRIDYKSEKKNNMRIIGEK